MKTYYRVDRAEPRIRKYSRRRAGGRPFNGLPPAAVLTAAGADRRSRSAPRAVCEGEASAGGGAQRQLRGARRGEKYPSDGGV